MRFNLSSIQLLAGTLVLVSCISGRAAEVRPLSTDRPDTTESPYTVDAGHFQFEMELANVARNGRSREISWGELNAKIGLDAATDLQVILPVFTQVRQGGEGFGNVTARLKRNCWGNDEAGTALAVMPFITLPTANESLDGGAYEGGVIVPFAFAGPADWSCAVMGELGVESDDQGTGHHFAALFSATMSHALTETTAVFFELVGLRGEEFESYLNIGSTWAISATCQLDGGIRLGLNDHSTDFTPFLGISSKF